MTDRTTSERRPVVDRYGPWVALYAAMALTASGEFELATLVGFPGWIAWALPTAIDVYVVQAIRRHRDVAAAILLSIASQALFHLADVGIFGVDRNDRPTWWLIVGVAAIAPVIVWRVHRIAEPKVPLSEVAVDKTSASAPSANSPAPAKSVPTEAPRPTPVPPTTPASQPTPVADNTAATADNNDRQDAVESPAPAAKKAERKAAKKARPRTGGRAPRRSMDEWVELTDAIFHAEFRRLRRKPTAAEFANAIEAAGYGRVSDSTAKNIRTEVIDRTPLPALDD